MIRNHGIISKARVEFTLFICLLVSCYSCDNHEPLRSVDEVAPKINIAVKNVRINDQFWSPKLRLWSDITVNDVFDKFDGKYDVVSFQDLKDDYERFGRTRDAFRNFDIVAQGKRGIGQHDGPEWYDGLVYESIRGASDFLIQYPDKKIEERIDAYIDRIEAAQDSEGDGYINTATLLLEPRHRWGLNGGFEPRQHDVYNSGMLMEAAVHYYNATGKTKLLNVAVKCANNICKVIGDEPKLNVIPGHAGPEEAIMKLYWLFKSNPDLKNKMSEKVNEYDYYHMAKFWVEYRGNHCGFPKWNEWSDAECYNWIRDNKYSDPKYGNHSRPSFGKNCQDSVSVFTQKTIEGHAVRATLFGTGIASVALESNDMQYIGVASSMWDNMVGRRMHITGGCGSLSDGEMFAPDYVLPNNGYLESCAGIGSGFFSERMSELLEDGKYVDELERTLYNSVLSGISLSGNRYTYENPLVGEGIIRWNWHSCPCCPPMFLKISGELPKYIYAKESSTIYVKLFIGSEAKIKLNDGQEVIVRQTANYPRHGHITINIYPNTEKEFTLKVRIPGWAQGMENPYGLYESEVKSKVSLKINGKDILLKVKKGYVAITRCWSKGDFIELNLPVEPRLVYANDKVANLKGMVAVSLGPIVYGFEEFDNPGLNSYKIDINSPINMTYNNEILNGVNIITCTALSDKGNKVVLTAVPFSTLNNRKPGNAFKVWMPVME